MRGAEADMCSSCFWMEPDGLIIAAKSNTFRSQRERCVRRLRLMGERAHLIPTNKMRIIKLC
jgi:hypothetical protein